MAKVFAKDGILAKHLVGYRKRPQQIKAASLIAKGIAESKSVIIEAPTGVGKSLAALIPVFVSILNSGMREQHVFVTATKTLQDQYMLKDLPFLTKMGFKGSFASIKGLNNFICQFKLSVLAAERNNDIIEKIIETTTKYGGDLTLFRKEDLPVLSAIFHYDLVASFDECERHECVFYGSCPYFNARYEANGANIIVTNYHYFLCHLDLVIPGLLDTYTLLPGIGYGNQLPTYVFDEAHILKGLLRDFNLVSLKPKSLMGILSFLATYFPDTAEAVKVSYNDLFSFLKKSLGINNSALVYTMNRDSFVDTFTMLSEVFLEELATGEMVINTQKKQLQDAMKQGGKEGRQFLKVKKLSSQIRNIQNVFTNISSLISDLKEAPPTYTALWIEKDDDAVSLNYCPVDVSSFRSRLTKVARQSTFMSATLDIPSFKLDLGFESDDPLFVPIDREIYQQRLPDVFNYAKQALLYVPYLVGEINSFEFDNSVASFIEDTVELLGGNILALFTSFKALRKAHERLMIYFSRHDRLGDLLVQERDSSTQSLAEQFRQGNKVLLGTKSFFQGVDFPGNILQCLIINQIPFHHYDDPIIATMKYFDKKDWFAREQIPYAKILFKQAFGRLIRTETDSGVIVCCDYRLLSTNYGKTIISSLPKNLPITEDYDTFLEKINELKALRNT